MSNRIQPTHFIEVWNHETGKRGNTQRSYPIEKLKNQISLNNFYKTYTIALFLIRPKTPQERENSIYYPKNTTI